MLVRRRIWFLQLLAGVLGQLHEEDWRTRGLALHLRQEDGRVAGSSPGEAGLEQEALQDATILRMPTVLLSF